MVEGAAFYLLCHDDVALDPDAVHKLVEESFRSNAGRGLAQVRATGTTPASCSTSA